MLLIKKVFLKPKYLNLLSKSKNQLQTETKMQKKNKKNSKANKILRLLFNHFFIRFAIINKKTMQYSFLFFLNQNKTIKSLLIVKNIFYSHI